MTVHRAGLLTHSSYTTSRDTTVHPVHLTVHLRRTQIWASFCRERRLLGSRRMGEASVSFVRPSNDEPYHFLGKAAFAQRILEAAVQLLARQTGVFILLGRLFTSLAKSTI